MGFFDKIDNRMMVDALNNSLIEQPWNIFHGHLARWNIQLQC